ncbi:MAG: L-histidine N(alpha)-methyltransferase [Acidobacteria bacterium]|nr:L-histidine N(alpha)-methyltransferase [Acidobacteriota bacterium]
MTQPQHQRISERFDLHLLGHDGAEESFAEDVRRGLTAEPKKLSPKYLYDALGSILFDAISMVPEYYLTRAEDEILEAQGTEIAALLPGPLRMVELGSGTSTKTKRLIGALIKRQERLHYLPIDVSASILERSSHELLNAFPGLSVTAFAADYLRALRFLAGEGEPAPEGVRTAVIFLGSSVGNLTDQAAARLLGRIRAILRPGDAFLLGADLRKSEDVLLAAYDDALGVTAAFNRNLLVRINRELGGTFLVHRFVHRARYNEARSRMEMHLESLDERTVDIKGLDLAVPFAAGETIHTESSHKYDRPQLEALATATGFRLAHSWTDAKNRFSENLLLAV